MGFSLIGFMLTFSPLQREFFIALQIFLEIHLLSEFLSYWRSSYTSLENRASLWKNSLPMLLIDRWDSLLLPFQLWQLVSMKILKHHSIRIHLFGYAIILRRGISATINLYSRMNLFPQFTKLVQPQES